MDKISIDVPAGIRYISQWAEFEFKNFKSPCIINKTLPGCGMTEFAIRNNSNTIICSPRKMLLENKHQQHPQTTYLVINDFEKSATVDIDLNKKSGGFGSHKYVVYKDILINMKVSDANNSYQESVSVLERVRKELIDYRSYCLGSNIPLKILVTYDSFRIIKTALELDHPDLIGTFDVFVDEFQTILHDAKFKSEVEVGLLEKLAKTSNVYFVSATPMLDKYLRLIPFLSSIPYYELDWKSLDVSRIVKPDLKVKSMKSINSVIDPIIESYRSGNFESAFARRGDSLIKVLSKEAVFYVNSVNHIVSIIKRNRMLPDEVNILCSNTPENVKRINSKLGRSYKIGSVPLKGEPRKMFTFCTRTVYLGADFYSDNARSFIFSDCKIESLAVDISQDLPQILGRQRLLENPWKNSAEFYYKVLIGKGDSDETVKRWFSDYLARKESSTQTILELYRDANTSSKKEEIALAYRRLTETDRYSHNYVMVGVDLKFDPSTKSAYLEYHPSENILVKLAEQRAFDIQLIDYKDRFSVASLISDHFDIDQITNDCHEDYLAFLKEYELDEDLTRRLKLLGTTTMLTSKMRDLFLMQLSDSDQVKQAVTILGLDRIRSLGYNITRIRKELGILTYDTSDIVSEITKAFPVGSKFKDKDIKQALTEIYTRFNLPVTAKSTDLAGIFEIKAVRINLARGTEILSVKSFPIFPPRK